MNNSTITNQVSTYKHHPGLGIASFIISIGTPLLIACLFIFSISLDSFLNGYQRRDFNLILGLLVISIPPFGHLIGLVLGIVGARQPDSRKLFPTLGIIFNCLFLLLGLALVIMVVLLVFAAAGGVH